MNALMNTTITSDTASKVLSLVNQGLVRGLGQPEPGKMCVEAVVNYALGGKHGDDPSCVLPALRHLKIAINDRNWSSDQARANGLKRLALAQLGSNDLNAAEFTRRVAVMAIRVYVPLALRAAAGTPGNEKHRDKLLAVADLCEREPTRENAIKAKEIAAAYAAAADAADAYAAYAAAYAAADAYAAYAAAYAAAADAAAAYVAAAADAAYAAGSRDSVLASFCEHVVGILIEMKAPGCQWLGLTVIEREADGLPV